MVLQSKPIKPSWRKPDACSMVPTCLHATGPKQFSPPPCCVILFQLLQGTISAPMPCGRECLQEEKGFASLLAWKLSQFLNLIVDGSLASPVLKAYFSGMKIITLVTKSDAPSKPLTINWEASRTYSELVDEAQPEEAPVVDETHSEETASPCVNNSPASLAEKSPDLIPDQAPCHIKVIGPRHPTLITSKIDANNILTISR
ncbi:hypothetical protein O181_000573 [Austropuccinia psidii MF-1]|uniref:Uncharacterized protein n=1 Tax=Austropuccinia psidii MF-1 TaxID=1389203 RepID=A0A9Q3B934_9BASI|nr:hypothetical protein [Austropuccinia psidii MF-1]